MPLILVLPPGFFLLFFLPFVATAYVSLYFLYGEQEMP